MHINTQTNSSVTTWRTLGKVASVTMETKVLVLLLASHCVPATDMTSLIASNYAKVHRTGSFASTEADRKTNGDMYDNRQQWGSEVTTEASDIYNVYYPVMEAQVVTDNNDTHTALHTPRTENPRTATSESSVSVLQLNPLAAFINAFFRQPVYVADNNEEISESSLSQDSAYDEPSSSDDTTNIPPTINHRGYSDQPGSYDDSPRLQANGRTAEYMDEGYTELMGEEQDIQYVNSHKYPPPDNKSSPFLTDEYQPTALNESYKQNDPVQPTKLGSYYELNRSYQSTLSDSYKLPEFYPPATSSNPYALKESYQPTSENHYGLNKDEYHSSAPPDEDDTQQESDYDYDSFKKKVSAKQGSTRNSHSTVSTPHKHQLATGREKNPYTYFYVGRKLWYVPLFFSVYFMLYVLALVVRSISKHKIVFPVTKTKYPYEKRELNSGLENIMHQVTTALETTERLYL